MASTWYIIDDEGFWKGSELNIITASAFIAGAPIPLGSVLLNLVEDQTHGSLAYTVSLIAEARGYRPVPSPAAMLTKASYRKLPRRDVVNKALRLGILHSPDQAFAPSSRTTLERFAQSAARFGIESFFLTRSQIEQVDGLDALFIRDLTSPGNHTYDFALRAVASGLPVIDSPRSIVLCSNKIFGHEYLVRHRVPLIPSVIVAPTIEGVHLVEQLGLPIVIKLPESSFCSGVFIAKSVSQVEHLLRDLRAESTVLIAQRFMPTPYDWRIGLLGGRAIFACQYHMAPGHWQILQHLDQSKCNEGDVLSVPICDVPAKLLALAENVARLYGNGFFGIDIKENGGEYFVVEVNDNPNLDDEFEASQAPMHIWEQLATWFRRRVERPLVNSVAA